MEKEMSMQHKPVKYCMTYFTPEEPFVLFYWSINPESKAFEPPPVANDCKSNDWKDRPFNVIWDSTVGENEMVDQMSKHYNREI